MSLELNADNLNEISSIQQQTEIKAKTTEEIKSTEQIQSNNPYAAQSTINSNFTFENESKEKEVKSQHEKKDSYEDDIKILKKEQPQMQNNFNYQPEAFHARSASNNNNLASDYSNLSNQRVLDINRISEFSNEYVDYSKHYEQNKQRFTQENNYNNINNNNNFSNNPSNVKYAGNININNNLSNNPNNVNNNAINTKISNFSNNPSNINNSKNNNIASKNNANSNNAVATGYWKMRYSMNPQLFQRIQREDEQLVQEHIHNQKKKETLDVSNYKNIDIDISYNNQKLSERSELTFFDDISDLDPQLKTNLHTLHFKVMTPIQREVIKFIRNGKDVMGCSQTGSGKTIAFLLPIISQILSELPAALNTSPPSPRLLILIPTRELAEQIWTEAKKLVKETGIIVNKIYGGVPHDEQLSKMYSGCDILVATPGRLLDFVKSSNLSLKNVKYLIMDEADRMLDMGFQPQLMKIAFGCDLMHKDLRQNLLFSATFTEEIKTISRNFMHEDYYFIQTIFEKNPLKNIKQELFYAAEPEKIDKLHGILKTTSGSIIIFVETKFGVDNLYLALKKYGHRVSCIHGDKKQQQRQEAIKRFSLGQISILIATDIASRGLDFPKVTHVINFDLPTNIEDYIHRIGRTGRCGNTGIAISFVNEYNKPIIRNLYYFMKKNHQKINDWFENLYKTCKDISVNIFDRIPKRPNRSLGGGAYGASKYSISASNSSYSAASASSNNYNSNAFNSYNSSNNSQSGNSYIQNNNNAYTSSSNFNNSNSINTFAQPISSSSSYDRSDKYDSSRRDSSSSKYAPSAKFSGSTTYNPSSSSQQPQQDSASTSRESGETAKYPSSYSRGASDYSSSSSSRHSANQFLGKKHPYPSSSSGSSTYQSSKDNEESSYQRNRRSRFDYDNKTEPTAAHSSSNNSDYNSSRKDRSEGYSKDYNRESSSRDARDYNKDNRNRSQSNSNYNNNNNYRGSERGDSSKSSNFTAPAANYRSSNFSSSSGSTNNFSSYPNASSRNNTFPAVVKDASANFTGTDANRNAGKSGFAAPGGANSMMYPQMAGMSGGVPMNYMYPGMNYANYAAAQSNSNNNNLSITENNNNINVNNTSSINNPQDPIANSNNINKPVLQLNPNVQANPAEAKNANNSSNNAAETSSNPYAGYYNYAAAYSAYGYGAGYPGYDPYNGQVYDAYKYNYGYAGVDGNANASKNAENKSNLEKK